eukprot:SAG31_NODE_3586_length_4094_cov_15.710388_5_plen_76_part_00
MDTAAPAGDIYCCATDPSPGAAAELSSVVVLWLGELVPSRSSGCAGMEWLHPHERFIFETHGFCVVVRLRAHATC